MQESRLSTEEPNITLVTRANGMQLEHLRETRSTTGEIVSQEDFSVTVEIITITRKTLSTIS